MRRGASLVVAGLLLTVGCADTTTTGESTGTAGPDVPEGAITVAAAASLSEAFTLLGDRFMAAHPGVEVTFTFDSSTRLAAQILEGAPADVLAAADETAMAVVTADRGVVEGPAVFARNELAIVTRPGNPGGIEGLADLADIGVVSLCAEQAPCGRFADAVLERAGVSIPEDEVTRGQHATATLTAVTEGDAEAGIVYASDAVRAGEAVAAVSIPAEDNVLVDYPIAVLIDGPGRALADAFVAFVLSEVGQEELEEWGFLPAA